MHPRTFFVQFLPLLLALVAVPAIAVEPVEPAPASEVYRVGPRDVLSIEVYGEADLTGSKTIDEDGRVVLNHVGPVEIAGLTTSEVRDKLTEALADGVLVNPQVSVEVAEYRSRKVDVMGAVGDPGEYFLSGPTTLLEVISRAGSIDPDKAAGVVTVSRGDEERVRIGLASLADTGDEVFLQTGDVVTVESGQHVYVSGEVAKPGAIVFAEGITVTEALSRAGGPSATAQLRGAYILRDGEKVPINLKRILQGRAADVEMEPGDQLFLRESPI